MKCNCAILSAIFNLETGGQSRIAFSALSGYEWLTCLEVVGHAISDF